MGITYCKCFIKPEEGSGSDTPFVSQCSLDHSISASFSVRTPNKYRQVQNVPASTAFIPDCISTSHFILRPDYQTTIHQSVLSYTHKHTHTPTNTYTHAQTHAHQHKHRHTCTHTFTRAHHTHHPDERLEGGWLSFYVLAASKVISRPVIVLPHRTCDSAHLDL